MKDLVSRLRAGSWANAPWEHEYKVPPTALNIEAADTIERLEKELEIEEKRFSAQWEILAESQAREAKLRDFIFDYIDIEPNNERMIARYETCVKPTDDTALKEYKRKVLLDAAAQLCTQRNSIPATGHEFANVLRILAEEVLK